MAAKKGNRKSKPRNPNKALSNEEEEDARGSVVKQAAVPTSAISCTRVFWVVFSISLAIYIPSVPPAIVGGDTGELLAEACQLGIAHPPGYPLYTLLAYGSIQLGNIIDGGRHSPAYYANLLSCLLGALASAILASSLLLYLAPVFLSKRKQDSNIFLLEASAATAALLHTLAPLTWQYSTVAEVFALHNFFVALLLYVTVQFARDTTSHAKLLIGALVCGLAMTNQHTSVLLELPIIAWVVYEAKLLEQPHKLAQVAACFFAGLLLYVYLVISAYRWPHRGSWGDLTTLQGFLNHLRRKDYGSFQLYSGEKQPFDEGWIDRFLLWFIDLVGVQIGNPLSILAFLYGCWSVVLHYTTSDTTSSVQRAASRVILPALVLYVVVFFTMSNVPISDNLYLGVLKRFWLHPNLLCFWLMGVGICKTSIDYSGRNHNHKVVPMALMVLSVGFAAWRNQNEATKASQNDIMRNYARAALESLPDHSLLFTSGDLDFTSIRYLQECENVRSDVLTASLTTMGSLWWKTKAHLYFPLELPGTNLVSEQSRQQGSFVLSELLDANYDTFDGNVFLSFAPAKHLVDSRYSQTYEQVNHGIVLKARRTSSSDPLTPEQYRLATKEAWKHAVQYMFDDIRDETKYHPESFELKTRKHFFQSLMKRATTLLDMCNRQNDEESTLLSLLEVVSNIEVARIHDEQLDTKMMKNLGIAYLLMTRNKETAYEDRLVDFEDVFNGEGMGEWWSDQDSFEHWKDWAKAKWLASFGEFLQMPGAEDDPQYEVMKREYERAKSS